MTRRAAQALARPQSFAKRTAAPLRLKTRRLPYAIGKMARLLARHALGLLAYATVFILALAGRLSDGGDHLTESGVAFVWVALVVGVVSRLWERTRDDEERAERLAALELGLLFIAAAEGLVVLLGGLGGPVYPLVYALVAYFAVFSATVDAAIFFSALLALEAAITFGGDPSRAEMLTFFSHFTWCAFFAILYALFLRGDVAERRRETAQLIRSKLEHILADARDWRLLGAVNNVEPDEASERRRALSSVGAVREAVYNLLSVGEHALQPHNLLLYVLDATGNALRLKEARGTPEEVKRGPLSVREGVFGGILAKKEPLVLTGLKGYRGLVYYEDGAPSVNEFCGVPLRDGAHVRGVLLCDRISPPGAERPFQPDEIELMQNLATEVMRTIEVERLFADMDRERKSRERFFRAHQAFGSARTSGEVAEAAEQAAAQLCEPALVGLTALVGEEHVVRALRGGKKTSIEGERIADASALVRTAMKTKSVLPLPGVTISEHSLFGRGLEIPGLSDARVFPLLVRDEPIGTWVVGVGSGKISVDLEQMLSALSYQVAISCANAELNEQMETMATTDALTGLHNRRAFSALFAERLLRAERYGRKCSVIMCDIDHFKTVNDTYGHPTGDMVLKTVSRLLQSEARKTDAVGRLGGEEFAIVMEETDSRAAKQTAERIRERVQKEVMLCELGKLQVTLSLGIATFPDDGNSLDLLISRADEALYRAKHGGRNRTVV